MHALTIWSADGVSDTFFNAVPNVHQAAISQNFAITSINVIKI